MQRVTQAVWTALLTLTVLVSLGQRSASAEPPDAGAAGLRPVAIAIATGELAAARRLLARDAVDPRDPAVPSLRRLVGLLEQPDSHIDEIVALAGTLAKLEGRGDGVPALGEALRRLWTPEQENARLAAEGARLVAASDHKAALAVFRRIGEASVFAEARRRGIARCQLVVARELLAAARPALEDGRLDRAERYAREALRWLPRPDKTRAERVLADVRRARLARESIQAARALDRDGQPLRALALLRRVPRDPPFDYLLAREVGASIELRLIRQADVLYRGGRGPEALEVLDDLEHARARGLSHRIRRVIALRDAALEAPERKALRLWQQLLRVEPDPSNAYGDQARASLEPQAPPTVKDLHLQGRLRAAGYAWRARDMVFGAGGLRRLEFERQLDAALLIGRALLLDESQSTARLLHIELQRSIKIELEKALGRHGNGGSKKAFLDRARQLYRLAAAAKPLDNPLRGELGTAIRSRQGAVPDPDRFPQRLYGLPTTRSK